MTTTNDRPFTAEATTLSQTPMPTLEAPPRKFPADPVRILFLGDVVGETGVAAIERLVPALRGELRADVVIANVENATDGVGIVTRDVERIFAAGVDFMTSGNHIFDKPEVIPTVEADARILRPINYPPGTPGRGMGCFPIPDRPDLEIGLLNLLGRTFLIKADCPFQAADRSVSALRERTAIVLVDMHGEVTSEKVAMGRFLAGRVSIVVGTHTHVQTADDRILPPGTAYVSDCGMCGGFDSVLGSETEPLIRAFLTREPPEFRVAAGDPRVQGVFAVVDPESGRAVHFQRIDRAG